MKAYKLSIMEINCNDDFSPQEYKEVKEKMFVVEGQSKEVIFDKFLKDLPYMLEALENGSNIKWQKVESETSKTNRTTKKFLLVEDGSVDVDFIENEYDIHCIVYRQGANKPEWLEV